ncbi:MAG: ACT domain-containing protein [Planctomycetota bacterium]|nr:ACT domain-containing protein [Planctomycetota bacterium]
MIVARQLSVFMANKPGVLAKLCESLAEHDVNIMAISVSDTVDHAVVRLIVSDPRKALDILESHNMLIVETDVLLVPVRNKPGELASLSRKLARARINIEYAYGSATNEGSESFLVLRVSDVAKARKALK